MPNKYITMLRRMARDGSLNPETAMYLLRRSTGVAVKGEDGGPGSGNWGHKGRPGKVGGSGKGGGKQYRGGRGDILFTGSRKDWMNGLSGERQDEAHDWLAKMRMHYSQPGEEEKSVEENVMQEERTKYGGNQQRAKLLEFMSEARGWDEHARKLIDENWDETDKKLAAALADKYGRAFVGQAEIPDESNALEEWDPEDLACWQSMKSKALGGPESGREPPDELQYATGMKERPKELKGVPANKEENQTWFDHVPAEYQGKIRTILSYVGISPEGFIGTDMNSAEQRLMSRVIHDLSKGESGSLDRYMDYLRTKEFALSTSFSKDLMGGEHLSNLTADQKKAAKEILELGAMAPNDIKLPDLCEFNMLKNKDIPDFVKAYYLGLKSKALGYDDHQYGRSLIEECYGQGVREILPTLQQRYGAMNKADYNERRQKNAVVIQGDTFSEKIASMRNSTGVYTVDEIRKIGEQFLLEQNSSREELERLNASHEETNERFRGLIDEFTVGPTGGESPEAFQERLDREMKECSARTKEIKEKTVEIVENMRTRSLLKRIRKTGVQDKSALKVHLPGRSTVKKYVEDAYEDYPSEWIEQSMARGIITLKKVNRGYCGENIIAISGTGADAAETATHELGHRFEKTVPGILEAEKGFYDERTNGERLRRLRDVTGRNYRWDEMTRVDKFINPYMGKDYGGRAYELVSMGFEMAFHNPTELAKDHDFACFIYGLLAVG